MNDVNERKEANVSDNGALKKRYDTSNEVLYKKLAAYLFLLYQCYLKKETLPEPEIKGALLRMVKFDQDYAIKIRMLQLDYLKKDIPSLTEKWDEAKDELFPITDTEISISTCEKSQKTIKAYKDEVVKLLQLIG